MSNAISAGILDGDLNESRIENEIGGNQINGENQADVINFDNRFVENLIDRQKIINQMILKTCN